ncbi:MAG: flavin-dependent monooxygenase, partial [Mycolicibacterium fortuitum]
MTSVQQIDTQLICGTHSVLAGVDELLPTLRERAQETEDLRRLPDANVKALEDVGFFKLLQPEQ